MSAALPASGGEVAAKAASRPVRAASESSPAYLLAVLGSALAGLAGFFVLLLGLQATDNLPPPAFANIACADEKMEFLRARAPKAPTLLVVGSSVAWRHFDGAQFEAAAPGAVALNGAFCSFTASQNVAIANWLLDRNPTVRDVLMVVDPQDFADCTAAPAENFNREDADRFVYSGAPRWGFYMRYFSPRALLHNAVGLHRRRIDKNAPDSLVIDRFGSWPLENTTLKGMPYGLGYGAIDRLDPACFSAVDGLARRLRSEGRRMMIVTAPLNPQWKTTYDPNGALFKRVKAEMRRIPGAEFWDGDGAEVVDQSAYWDAIHMRWPAARHFSGSMVKAFHFGNPGPDIGLPEDASASS